MLLSVLSRIVRAPSDSALSQDLPSTLDPTALADPERALACAAREVLHMGETAEGMLRVAMPLFAKWDKDTADGIAAAESKLDSMHSATKVLSRQDRATGGRSRP